MGPAAAGTQPTCRGQGRGPCSRAHRICALDEAEARPQRIVVATYNAKFAKPPRDTFDAHRPLGPNDDLDRIFCQRELQTMTGKLAVHFERRTCIVTPTAKTHRLAGRRRHVVVYTWADGRLEIHFDGRSLPLPGDFSPRD